MTLPTLHIQFRRGETVAVPVRVESDTLVYKSISAITRSGPVTITATGHACPDGWRAAVANAGGMTQINYDGAEDGKPPKDSELQRVTVVDPNTVQFNAVNSAGFRAYTSGGQLVYYAPKDMALYASARMDIKDRVGGTVLLSLNTTGGTLELDSTDQVVWIRLTAAKSAALTFDEGVFDLELIDLSGKVEPICDSESTVTVLPEVTTTS